MEIIEKCTEAKYSEVKSQKWSEVNEAKWSGISWSEVQYRVGGGGTSFYGKGL